METQPSRRATGRNPNPTSSPLKQHVSSSSSSSSFSAKVKHENDDTDAYLHSFPPGYRFNPLDKELVLYYLTGKVANEPLPPNLITDVNLYKYNPKTLAERYKAQGEKQWYFFTPRDRKYRNGNRPNRAAGDGYWKATGADTAIKSDGVKVGFKKSLVFYRGKPPKGDKTTWIMHEYRINMPPKDKGNGNDMRLDDWVLCRIYKKKDKSIGVRARQKDDDEIQTDEQPDDAPETLESHTESELVEDFPIPAKESPMHFNEIDPISYNSNINHPMVYGNAFPHHFPNNFIQALQFQGPMFEQTFMFNDHHPAMNNMGYNYENQIEMVAPISSQLPMVPMQTEYNDEFWDVPSDSSTQSDFSFDQCYLVENNFPY